jgi:2-dehydro-3-deoxygluconokinase
MDVVTLGETMLRLSVGEGQTLEAADAYRVDVAGAESNVAIDLARLGLRTGWISRLPDHAMGQRVAHELQRHSVDVSRVVWAPADERQATFFIEFAPLPRGTQVTYDRSRSAFSHIQPDEIDWAYARAARWLHLTGITPALGPGPLATVERALTEASAAGLTISLDVNYRSKLWSAEAAAACLSPLLAKADVLVCGLRDAIALFQTPDDAEGALAALHRRFLPRITLLTLGDGGAAAFDGEYHRQPALSAETLDPIGSGDAFVAGFVAGHLEGGVACGLLWGVGLAALKRTYRGDVVWCSRQVLLAALDQAEHKAVSR